MTRFLSSTFRAAAALAIASAAAAPALAAGDEELRVALAAALDRAGAFEEENARLRESNAALARSLAAANEDSRATRAELAAIRSELDTLGVSLFDQSDRDARRRLIEAIAETDRLADANDQLRHRILEMAETLLILAETGPELEAEQRMRVESQVRAAEAELAAAAAPGFDDMLDLPATLLADASVISISGDLDLAVIDAGTRSGVRIGMPVEFMRQDRRLGTGLGVDVRRDIAGVVPVDATLDVASLGVGDRARPRLLD